MNHWIIAPVVLPAILAPVIAFVMRHDITLARAASFAGTITLAAICIGLTVTAAGGETVSYALGNWPAPFGIVLVLDRLSAVMLLLTALLALIVLLHAAATGWDARGRHFHALFQFQLMGICGAFLTGDAFNLFVFFEVLLIASYGLMIHGGGRVRLQAGLQYVVMNLAGSTLFLFALGTLYAATGTLNIADLAEKVRALPVEDAALVRSAAMMLMIVFAIKAALFPVQFWLPGTYANAPAPVAALFAIMTKVGAYAIVRVHSVVFGPDVPVLAGLPGTWLMPAALVTLAVGAIGVLGARRLMPLLSFSVVGSMGTMMIAVAAFTPQATSAALYYLVHSTFSAAALFLLADLVVSRRDTGDLLRPQSPTVQNGLFAALFFAGAIGMVGMPPLSGFLGKLLILDAMRDTPEMAIAFVAILLGSLLMLVGFARAGSILFWKSTAIGPAPTDATADEVAAESPEPARFLEVAPTAAALALLAGLAVFAGPVSGYLGAASWQLFDSSGYVAAVLGQDEEG
ncbi:multicomponent K+:H+ antiporter subunit D [Lutimaribacter pacificus]|uniref:Multisubunit potassium/proton antiporter, PhaD subunit n=1 Tax=Lutimaribacter pacificus TaxID=391948 RepID=A0A1H0BLF3_9RHOB|nr:monovalent cation/H+ antiporter subunit D [Lutimaribacter pacificus]SDN46484.1 multicomponent K+:H+ antiporter subunit D [Lutimaribacter pacificus]SHJ54781.1 multisubunit potassium/proton antiporter, PhaD subunit [Lutimaribacter pacificus]